MVQQSGLLYDTFHNRLNENIKTDVTAPYGFKGTQNKMADKLGVPIKHQREKRLYKVYGD